MTSPEAGAGQAPPPEDLEYRISEDATFQFRGAAVLAHQPRSGASLAVPARLFPLVRHFQDWRPISSVFLLPECGGEIPLPDAFAVLRDLLEARILVPRSAAEGDGGPDEIWAPWGASRLYYLDSRTLADQPYYDSEEMERELADRAQGRPQPSSYKDYPDRPFFPLEDPLRKAGAAGPDSRFLDVLLRRRTCRAYAREPMSQAQLSRLLYFTWGATRTIPNRLGEDVFLRKTSPSGGSLHCTEVYPILLNVEGLEPGVYHYSVRRHGLELLSREDPRPWIGDAAGGQAWIAESAVVFLSTSMLRRMAWKYQSPRALRVVLLDIGHLSQTFYLVATWLGLGAFTTGALRDERFEQKIGLDADEEPVILLNGAGHIDDHEGGWERPRSGVSGQEQGGRGA